MFILAHIVLGLGPIYILFTIYQKWGRPAGFPPGPPVLPLIGSIPFLLKTSPAIVLKNARAKYGDIIGLKLGTKNAVVLSNLDHIREAFNDIALVSIQLPNSRLVEQDTLTYNKGLIRWIEQRRFAMKNLRDLGTRKKTHEAMVLEDIQDLLEIFKSTYGKPVLPTNFLSYSILNSLWHVLAGKRFELTDPKFQDIVDKMVKYIHTFRILHTKNKYQEIGDSSPFVGSRALRSALHGVIPVLLPRFSALFPELSGLNELRKVYGDVYTIIQVCIDEHKLTYQKDHLRDYMDTYLHEIESTNYESSTFYKETGASHLLFWNFSLFLTGIETTTTTLVWSFYLLTKNLEAQKKLQEEIDTVVGTERLPSLSDRPNMRYAEALIMEILRISSIGPLGIAHFAMEDIKFYDYTIPKGTLCFPNLYSIHHDEKVWGDPENFRPERFLEPNGKQIRKIHPPIAPFSVGKKACPGETLARNNLFLFIMSIFQRFSLSRDPNSKFEENKFFMLLHQSPKGKYIFQERERFK